MLSETSHDDDEESELSDAPLGEGWWIATDGCWYPPEQHPDAARSRRLAPHREEPPHPGWWRAADGNWYAPELHPEAASMVARPAPVTRPTSPIGHELRPSRPADPAEPWPQNTEGVARPRPPSPEEVAMQRPDDPPGDPTDFFTGNSSVMRRPVNTELVVALVVVILIAAGAITYLLVG